MTGPTKITQWLLGKAHSNSDSLCVNVTYPDGWSHCHEKWILSHMDRDMARSWFGAVSCSGEVEVCRTLTEHKVEQTQRPTGTNSEKLTHIIHSLIRFGRQWCLRSIWRGKMCAEPVQYLRCRYKRPLAHIGGSIREQTTQALVTLVRQRAGSDTLVSRWFLQHGLPNETSGS